MERSTRWSVLPKSPYVATGDSGPLAILARVCLRSSSSAPGPPTAFRSLAVGATFAARQIPATAARTSALVRYEGHSVLIDTATELRAQALANDVRRVDAVLMTHAHADHTGGFDDLRRFNELQGAHIPVYADPGTASMLQERYAYTFTDLFPFYGGKPDLLLHEIDGAI